MGFLDILGGITEKVIESKDNAEANFAKSYEKETRKIEKMKDPAREEYLKKQLKKIENGYSIGFGAADSAGKRKAVEDAVM